MSLIEQLTADLTEAMKARDQERTGVLRLLKSAMTNERIKLGHELSEDEALKVLQREAKQRRDSIEQYQAASRPELADAEQLELGVIGSYLPTALTTDELKGVIEEVVNHLGGDAQMGAVIGSVRQRVGAAADGAEIARLVKERLAA